MTDNQKRAIAIAVIVLCVLTVAYLQVLWLQ